MVSCDPSLNDASGALDDVLEVRRPPSRTSQKTSTEKLVIHDGLAEDALFFPSLAETPKLGVCVQRSAMNDTDILRVCKVLSRVVVNQVCDVKNLFAENTETWNRADTWHKNDVFESWGLDSDGAKSFPSQDYSRNVLNEGESELSENDKNWDIVIFGGGRIFGGGGDGDGGRIFGGGGGSGGGIFGGGRIFGGGGGSGGGIFGGGLIFGGGGAAVAAVRAGFGTALALFPMVTRTVCKGQRDGWPTANPENAQL
ncbi:hypothetical protein PPROV_000145100 [Pycnococcus provasolii]|uniref:Uncharacterized protein n=1 Tax=Pycnococcus provasolii TaxID=41880 RepID=A0A830H657_9CHLO|nr:hypothetical protein PPROV_000145100 [Pycnococcus provasolii]